MAWVAPVAHFSTVCSCEMPSSIVKDQACRETALTKDTLSLKLGEAQTRPSLPRPIPCRSSKKVYCARNGNERSIYSSRKILALFAQRNGRFSSCAVVKPAQGLSSAPSVPASLPLDPVSSERAARKNSPMGRCTQRDGARMKGTPPSNQPRCPGRRPASIT